MKFLGVAVFNVLVALAVARSDARAAGANDSAGTQPGLVKSEPIFEQAPFKFAHSSTIVQNRDGSLLAAWAAGSRDRALDVEIWQSRYENDKWSEPAQVQQGYGENGLRRYPCWNPVLFQPKFGPLLMFYKSGESPETWMAWVSKSDNEGFTWSDPKALPQNYWGPIRNKPVELAGGKLLCGSSTESAGWRVHMEWLYSPGRDYVRTEALNESRQVAAIQPTILMHRPDQIQILCRTKQGRIYEAWSQDQGKRWTPLARTMLPNPNSAIDGLKLSNGQFLLVYNHSSTDRGVLNVAVSHDGQIWEAALVLENTPGAEFSYPAVIQTRDELVHVTYSANRERIKHVVIDPTQLKSRPMNGDEWP